MQETKVDGAEGIRSSLTYKGVQVSFDYQPKKHFFAALECCYDHFQFRSKAVSPTGYYSWFAPCVEVESAGGYEAAALLFVEAHFLEEERQCSLFG